MTIQGDASFALAIFVGVLAALLIYRGIDRWLTRRHRIKQDAAALVDSRIGF